MATKKTKMVGVSSDARTAVLPPARRERRKAPRLKLPRVEAEVVSLGVRARVLDIAFGGLSIESDHEFSIGDVHTLRSVTSSEDTALLRVRVVHCRQERANRRPCYVTGLEFVDPWCPGDFSAADEFISQVTTALGKPAGR